MTSTFIHVIIIRNEHWNEIHLERWVVNLTTNELITILPIIVFTVMGLIVIHAKHKSIAILGVVLTLFVSAAAIYLSTINLA